MARIVIIEDNEVNLELMTFLLQSAGHETLCAETGEEGLALMRREHADVVLCDILMPAMDGFAVAAAVRADPALAHLRLVAVTALAMVGDRERALAAGFDAYVTKPIDPRDFVDEVERMMMGPRTQGPAPSAERPSLGQTALPEAWCAPRPGLVVLMVDDRSNQLEFKRDLLEPAGYQVVCADSVEQGWAWLQQQPVDLVLSDVVMPGAGGFELLRRLRADSRLRALPFLFLTSTARDPGSRLDGLALGADGYLIRPIEPSVLLHAIRQALGRPGQG